MRFTKSIILVLGFAGLALAENYSGKLVDANCKPPANATKGAELPDSCAVNSSTKVFAIQTAEGQIYRLDAAGNAKAAAAVKAEPGKTTVNVSGSIDGQMLKVESLDAR